MFGTAHEDAAVAARWRLLLQLSEPLGEHILHFASGTGPTLAIGRSSPRIASTRLGRCNTMGASVSSWSIQAPHVARGGNAPRRSMIGSANRRR